MAQVIIRNIEDETLERLRARARRKGVSLEKELRELLMRAARVNREEFRRRAAALRRRVAKRIRFDSVELLREDRDR
jgi:plasmid stability protein